MKPRALKLGAAAEKVDWIIYGQGVAEFTVAAGTEDCQFLVGGEEGGLRVRFSKGGVLVHELPSEEPLVDKMNTKGLSDCSGATYWFSLDSQNQRLHAGQGEARIETAVYTYQFTFAEKEQGEANKKFLEGLRGIKFSDPARCSVFRVLRDPITRSVPLHVKNTQELTMDMIASGKHLPKANLSLVAQKLHDCIAGERFILDDPTFPNFSKAIERSIATPGLWCYETLKRKATEFSKEKPNPAETYLRITLGENNGESPGIPYVMEIWPVGHYSPIHNHGSADAIIRVLHGGIHVSLFPFLGAAEPFGSADFKKGDVTWISPSLNQVHQLRNLEGNKDTCITIQCYMYENEDTTHYDYFDYLDEKGQVQQYEPDSDMDFQDFKKTMRQEWDTRPRNWLGC